MASEKQQTGSGGAGSPATDDRPDVFTGAGWQRVDEEHPSGSGQSCYRVVFKTLRVAAQAVELKWPNLLVRIGAGEVESGGFSVQGALPTRVPQNLVLPEFGQWLSHDDGSVTYEPVGRVDPHLQAWEEATPPLFYVEILLDTVAEEPREVIPEGRRRTSGIITMLELTLGSRLIGPVLAEEAGERFGDGHFNRHIGTEQFVWEPQLNVAGLHRDTVTAWSQSILMPWMTQPKQRRQQVSLACEWYQSAKSSSDPVLSFLQYWFAAEVLSMQGSTDVAVLRDLLIQVSPNDEVLWREVIGRLYGRRGDLVHGSATGVSSVYIDAARCLVEYLLIVTWRSDPEERLEALHTAGKRLLQ